MRAFLSAGAASVLGLGAMYATDHAMAQSSAFKNDAERLVGIWRLVSITTDGKVNPLRGGKPTGYIFYTASGHMGAHIQPDRAPIKMASKQPSEAEAREALRGYTAYWGTYKIDDRTKVVTHQRIASVQPGTEVDALRNYSFEGDDRLVLGGVGTTNRNVWERIRTTPGSGRDADRLVGIYKLIAITQEGKVNPLRGASPTGFIFYTSSGEMSALIQPDRPMLPKAGKEVSGAEALAALKGFTAYFGTFSVDEGTKVVTHHRKASVQPGYDAAVLRTYSFRPGGRLHLGTVDGKAELIWEAIR